MSSFFKKLVDKKNDETNFKSIPKANEENLSTGYGCIRFIDSYRFLSNSLDSLVKTLVDISHKTLKHLKEEIIDNVEILNNVEEIEEEDRIIKDIKKTYPEEYKKLEEALHNCLGESELKILKTEIPDDNGNI